MHGYLQIKDGFDMMDLYVKVRFVFFNVQGFFEFKGKGRICFVYDFKTSWGVL